MKDTAKKFNELSLVKQAELVHRYGKWIWFTDYNEFRISVFEIEGEITEVWYHVYQRCVWRIRIPNYSELDIHLHGIEV